MAIVTALLVAGFFVTAGGSIAAGAENAFETFNNGKASLEKGEYDRAIQAFSRALSMLASDQKNAQAVLLSRAQAHKKKGDLESAWKDVGRVLSFQALDGETKATALIIRGIINNDRGRENQALQDLTEAIKTPYDDTELRSYSFANRGMVYIGTRRFDEAISDFNKAIELHPRSPFSYAGRGLAHLRKDNIESARRDTNKAMSMDPDQHTAKIAEQVLKALSVSFSGPDRVSVPLTDDGHVFVQVRFGKGGQPHRFLLDTGATHTLISKELLERIRSQTEVTQIGTGRALTADGAAHTVYRYKVKNVFIYNLPLGEIEVHVFAGQRRMAANLLGARSLKQIAISIDNAAGKAEIRRTE